MFILEFGELVLDKKVSSEQDLLLYVNSSFRVRVGQVDIVDEPSFPVLELMLALRNWEGSGTFEYQSMEADVSPLLFVETEFGYYIASPLSRTCSDVIIDKSELLATLRAFIEKVRHCADSIGLPFLP